MQTTMTADEFRHFIVITHIDFLNDGGSHRELTVLNRRVRKLAAMERRSFSEVMADLVADVRAMAE